MSYKLCLRCDDKGCPACARVSRLQDHSKTPSATSAETHNTDADRITQLTAKLGRAIAALRAIERGAMTPPAISGALTMLGIAETARTILADADSKAAGEAYLEKQAVIMAAIRWRNGRPRRHTDLTCGCLECALCDSVAAVDARRGQGGGQ